MKIRYKVWLETDDNKYILGPGGYKILKSIEVSHSLFSVAENLGISYRHLWGLLKKIERNLGDKVVYSKRGVRGKTELTSRGKELVETYEKVQKVFEYYSRRPYIRPAVTVDGVLLHSNTVLLVRRGREPFAGMYALPGGFVEYGETVEEAIVREVKEETGLVVRPIKLVGVYSDRDRDPRGHTISIAFLLEMCGGTLNSGDDASDVLFFPVDRLPPLAFDHKKIIEDSLRLLSFG